jgi:GTPase
VEEIALGILRKRLSTLGQEAALSTLAAQVAAGELDPFEAADRLLAGLDAAPADQV